MLSKQLATAGVSTYLPLLHVTHDKALFFIVKCEAPICIVTSEATLYCTLDLQHQACFTL